MFNKSKWISSKLDTTNILVFRKEFNINKEIQKATLNICGLGFYSLQVNDLKFQQEYFKPIVSDYKKRDSFYKVNKTDNYFAYFDTYDITQLLSNENSLEVHVSTGYFHNVDKKDFHNVDYGKDRLIFEINIKYQDGSKEKIVSDENVLVAISQNKSNLFLGDRVNFNEEFLKFEHAVVIDEHINLRPSPIRSDEVIDVYDGQIINCSRTSKLFDFGKNHTGRLLGIIKGKKNQKITIKFGEFLNPDGSLNLKSSSYDDFICDRKEITQPFWECKKPKEPIYQIDEYILSGGNDILPTLFSYRCYRYAEISSDEPFIINEVQSKFISTNLKQTINLKIDNQIIQDIFDKGIQTIKCNLHNGFLTDCPHREKLPYTGDGNIVAETLLSTFESVDFLSKWLDDIIVSQLENGFIPYTAPDYFAGGGYYWSYAIVKLPLLLYKKTNKIKYLKKSINAIEKFHNFLKLRDNGSHILDYGDQLWQLPDWLAPMPMEIDTILFNTACYFDVTDKLIYIKQLLDENVDDLKKLKNDIKKSFNDKFFNNDTFTYSNDKQGISMFCAYLGLVEENKISKVNNAIKLHYKNNNYHLDTGIILTPILFEYLTNNGMEDIAWKILNQKDYPSFFDMLSNETTFPEHWSKHWISFSRGKNDEVTMGGDTSHCHPMYSAIISWILKDIIGIDFSKKNIDLNNSKPKFNKYIKSYKLTYLNKSLEYNGKETIVK